MAKCTATVKRGYSEKEGPFVKTLDNALRSFGVQRQQYFGGAFIGNHVHKALKVKCYTYVVVAFGEDSPVTEIPIRHALDRRQSVEQMVRIKTNTDLNDSNTGNGNS